MDWRLQVIKQSLTCRVPCGDSLRRLKRRWLGYAPDAENLRYTLENFEQMKSELDAIERSFRGVILEIGTGWFPAIPLMLSTEGAEHVYMTDLNRHMDDITFQATLDFLKEYRPDLKNLSSVRSLDEIPATYLAPFDVSQVSDNSIDLITSRTVMEHVPRGDIVKLLSSLRPKLTPDGLMIHLIDNSDHLEFSDKSVSRVNFLTWSERKHSLINSLIKGGENRLRHHEYPPIFERAGFDVVTERALVNKATLDVIDSLDLASPFSEMTPQQLATLTSIFVLAPSDGTRTQH